MLTIHLKNLQFFAYHGLYEEEKILGNNFIVNVQVNIGDPTQLISDISEAVNYELIFNIVKKQMMQPTPLLETLVMLICKNIMQEFVIVKRVIASVEKVHPPIIGFNGGVVVSYEMGNE